MIAKTLTLAAAALFATTTAAAQPVSSEDAVTATYQFSTKRFCVRANVLQPAERTGTRLSGRQCLTRQEWRERGIAFATPQRSMQLASS